MKTLDARTTLLNNRPVQKGDYVLYWMQQSQRAEQNPALTLAIEEANRLKQPLLVGFGLTDAYPDANLRHYTFMLEGLKETQKTLADRNIRLVVQKGSPEAVALQLGKKASLIICDAGWLRHQKAWRQHLATRSAAPVMQVDGDVVVPTAAASPKAEYAARTLRPKINKQLDRWLVECPEPDVRVSSLELDIPALDLNALPCLLEQMDIDRKVQPVSQLFKGGTSEAIKRLHHFASDCLHRYDQHSNQPQTDDVSHLSPYLHFGQISPVYIARRIEILEQEAPEAVASFLEELIIRRELAVNFVRYTPRYDTLEALPAWAWKTLKEHRSDMREFLYSTSELEEAATHDPYWNAAMLEMKHTGFMHNYMRMYWGKKVLEWTPSPETAFATLLYLNNKYFLDGRDPNSYAGVGWIFGLHDRAWKERAVYGKVRYMAASGLERKCDIKGYVKKVADQVKKLAAA